MQGVSEALGYIAHQAPVGASVLILARNHASLLDKQTLQAIQSHYQQLSITQMTFHSAKGKEADYGLLIGLESKSLPSRVKSAPILEALLPEAERFAYAEERRLFYVALTRAKKQLVMVVPEQSASEFVKELNL
jgi:DNA helicase-4